MVVLVLDFDGTMTDAEEEGRPYRQGCLEDLAVLCGLASSSEADALANRFEAELKDSPHMQGWEYVQLQTQPLCWSFCGDAWACDTREFIPSTSSSFCTTHP
jgi:hypothetical protein